MTGVQIIEVIQLTCCNSGDTSEGRLELLKVSIQLVTELIFLASKCLVDLSLQVVMCEEIGDIIFNASRS
jgi:hypothetical protein